MSGRNTQVSRIYTILNLLEGSPQGLTVAEVCDRIAERHHNASKRTVYRDLEALSSAGFPLFEKEENGDSTATRWVLERTAKINQYLVLTSRELVALYLARGALTPLKDTPFFEDLNQAFNRIEEKLGTKHQDYFKQLSNEMHFEPGPRWGLGIDPDLLETVRACCAEKQVLSVAYSSVNSKNKRPRKLGPHYLYFAQGSLYLVAEDMEAGKVKVFSLPRMSDAEMLDEKYTKEPIFPDSFFEHSFGVFHGEKPVDVQIEFLPTIASYVKERRWHQSQRVVSKADGSILVNLQVTLTPDLTQWVLGFGINAKVIEPESLKLEIIRSAEKLVQSYGKRKAA